MNKWMVAFLGHSVFQEADTVLLLRRRTGYNGSPGSVLSNLLLLLAPCDVSRAFRASARKPRGKVTVRSEKKDALGATFSVRNDPDNQQQECTSGKALGKRAQLSKYAISACRRLQFSFSSMES